MAHWVRVIGQLIAATRVMLHGHTIIPAWRIEARDGPWLILTPFDQDKPDQRGRTLQLIRRFMAWKHAESFILVGNTRLGGATTSAGDEVVFALGHVRGERLAFVHRIQREPSLSFGGLECVKPREMDAVYWSILPAPQETVTADEAAALAIVFGEHGEFPAHKLK